MIQITNVLVIENRIINKKHVFIISPGINYDDSIFNEINNYLSNIYEKHTYIIKNFF